MEYHINPHSGKVSACHAQKQCPFGGPDEHYPNDDAAREAYEAQQVSQLPAVRRKKIASTVESSRYELEATLDDMPGRNTLVDAVFERLNVELHNADSGFSHPLALAQALRDLVDLAPMGDGEREKWQETLEVLAIKYNSEVDRAQGKEPSELSKYYSKNNRSKKMKKLWDTHDISPSNQLMLKGLQNDPLTRDDGVAFHPGDKVSVSWGHDEPSTVGDVLGINNKDSGSLIVSVNGGVGFAMVWPDHVTKLSQGGKRQPISGNRQRIDIGDTVQPIGQRGKSITLGTPGKIIDTRFDVKRYPPDSSKGWLILLDNESTWRYASTVQKPSI